MLSQTALGQKHKNKDWVGYGIVATIVLLIVYGLLSPSLYYKVGVAFFGEIPSLYNVRVAKYLFTYASYPPVGKAEAYAHHQLSRTLFILGDLEGSRTEAERELIAYPDHIQTRYVLALAYGHLGENERAIEEFSVFIEKYPTSWVGRNDKAWVQFRAGDVRGALQTIEPIVEDNEDNPWVQNTYGLVLLSLGRYDEAKEALFNAQEASYVLSQHPPTVPYPSVDPDIYEAEFRAMQNSIESNIRMLESKR